MTAEQIVDTLLEAEFGPPVPDNFTNAMGSAQDLIGLEQKKLKTMKQLVPSLGIERQLRQHGIARDQIGSYIRAKDKYPGTYSPYKPNPRGQLPPDAIVGIRTQDGQEIMFDLAVMPEEP